MKTNLISEVEEVKNSINEFENAQKKAKEDVMLFLHDSFYELQELEVIDSPEYVLDGDYAINEHKVIKVSKVDGKILLHLDNEVILDSEKFESLDCLRLLLAIAAEMERNYLF